MRPFSSNNSGQEAHRAERFGHSAATAQNRTPKEPAWKMLPHVWALIKPRRGILAIGFALMALNRVSGLVLPASSKYFFDDILLMHRTRVLMPLVLAIFAATVVQAITSFLLTQLLSKSSQRMITELRVKVQEHIGRLPVCYYDANKTGALVS